MNEIMTVKGIGCYEKDGTAYLKLEDVAKGLGLTDKSKSKEYVRWNLVRLYLNEIGFSQEVAKDTFIPENIFYRLSMKAKNEAAKKFQAFIADEVVPCIRKHGAYLTPEKVEEALLNPDFLIRLATELKSEREKRMELEEKVEQDKPKVLFADAVSASDDCILVSELAKILKQNGVKTGQNRLFSWLRKHGYLIRRMGADYNMPTQRSMEMELFQIQKIATKKPGKPARTTKTVLVTAIGQQYFINKFLGKDRFSLLTDWDDFDVTDCEMRAVR